MRLSIIIVGLALVGLGTVLTVFGAQKTPMEVYKTPYCGCCDIWMSHMEKNGFAIQMIDLPDMTRDSVPSHLASCHTAYLGDYVVEGHIPAKDIRRLLKEQPKISGLVLPGMPEGSPGMPGPNPVAYDVLSFNSKGEVNVFASHEP